MSEIEKLNILREEYLHNCIYPLHTVKDGKLVPVPGYAEHNYQLFIHTLDELKSLNKESDKDE
jgi:hypothetical protein